MTFRHLFLVPVLALALIVPLAAAPAHAATRRGDPHDAPYPIDTRRVALYPNFKGVVAVQMFSDTYRTGKRFNGVDVVLDTHSDGRADYRLIWAFSKDGDRLERFELWQMRGKKYVRQLRCRGMDGKGRSKIRALEMYIPRPCLRITKPVGMYTVAWDYTKYNTRGYPVKARGDRAPNSGWLR